MPVSIILPVLHTLHLTSVRTKGWNMGALQQSNSFVGNEKCWKDRWFHTKSVCAGQKKGTQDFFKNWTGWPKNSQPFWKPDVHYHVHHSLLWNPVISTSHPHIIWLVQFVLLKPPDYTTEINTLLINGVPRNFVWGGSTNSVEDRENGDLGGGSPLVRGSGGSCNLVQEISFHIVKFS